VLARPVASLAPAFGETFRDALLGSPIGQWTVLQSKDGWHVVRLDSRRPGQTARFEDVIEEADRIWRTEQSRLQAWEAVNRLKTSYKVEFEK
jgi:parvulin-like peptidyl-prolyl isomerase